MARLAAIYRHPVKSLGEERLAEATLEAGRHFPWDRVWAVAHGGSSWTPDAPAWAERGNFVAQAHVPELARVATSWDPEARRLTLSHPVAGETALDPDTEAGAAALTAFAAALAEGRRPGPFRLARVPGQPMTDVADAHVAILGADSLRALEDAAGAALAHIRFRGNLWVEGLGPWGEFDLLGREIEIGGARLRVTERITRCNATAASPDTGTRDVPVPKILEDRWGHMDFGVYAQVVSGGSVAEGDAVRA